MGLTIHYHLTAPTSWTPKIIRQKLEVARMFTTTLPVVAVSELAEFRGLNADFQHIRDSGQEEKDDFFWAKIQAQRSLLTPWEPGTHGSQSPSHMLVFSVHPAEGCEEMNVGVCSYPRHVWKPGKRNDLAPAWSLVFDERYDSYPESRKVMRAFLRRWKLRRMPDSKHSVSQRFGGADRLGYYHPSGMANATVQRGRYLSHRKGYSGPFGLVTLRDRMKYELCFRFMGTAEEAEKTFASPEFIADLNRLVSGADHITPAARGQWSSFCKTQYANDPRCGGWNNFAKAHLSVCAILEHLKGLGFEIGVNDEGGFWEKRDIAALAKTIGEWDTFIAGMAGVMKDVAEKHGMGGESAMSGRPDFERLEAQAHGDAKIADVLKKMGQVMKPNREG